MAVILIDFDGVINNHKTSLQGETGEKKFGALDAIESFIKDGFEVIVFTARDDKPEVKKWLKENKFPKLEVTSEKLPADLIIDDRAYRFNSWNEGVVSELKMLAGDSEKNTIAASPETPIGNGRRYFEKAAGRSF